MPFCCRRGFILISALWTLVFLSVLAVTLLAGVRQRIILFQRLEDRGRNQLAAEAGAKKATAVLLDDMDNAPSVLTPQAKQRRLNDPGEFANIPVGGVRVEVAGKAVYVWGLGDEASKININKASSDAIKRLFVEVLGLGAPEAKTLADAVTDWRDHGQHQALGFFSDDYYKGLEFPYAMKEKPFERPDELLLVKGINQEIYDALQPFVTIYGDGRVNINTTSSKILVALGLEYAVADKVLKARRGADNVEATADDHVFLRTFDVASETARVFPLEQREARQIDALNASGLLTVEPGVYSFISRVLARDGGYARTVGCVFSPFDSRILYWNEK